MMDCPATHPALPALFDPHVPDHPALWAVFEGRHAGRAVMDDVRRPSQVVVRTDACLTYCSRDVSATFLTAAIAHLRQIGPIWLIWPSATSSPQVTPPPTAVIRRLGFSDCDPHSALLADWRRRVPDGFAIRPIDRELLARCEWRSDMEFYCGSVDSFLANGIGLCLMQGDATGVAADGIPVAEILVEAYASSLGRTHAEIGAVTREAHRGRGYAPIACAYLIDECARRGYQAYWSCDADNPASARVAHKLGFRHEQAYLILEWGALA
jgi:GNAT superfamily N-acetyltransferase